jgi:coproporphyrinogen III oxidase
MLFWNAHEMKPRGIGGLFFDYCKETKNEMEDLTL